MYSLHHAYLIAGTPDECLGELEQFFKDELGIVLRGNPDYWRGDFTRLGIDTARELIERASRRAVGGSRKIFVLTTHSVTREAQNALLKLFEDPPADTHFFLIIPRPDALYETLLSRLAPFPHLVPGGTARGTRADDELAAKFLAASPGVRSELIADITHSTDRARAGALLDALECALYQASPPSTARAEVCALFSLLADTRRNLALHTASTPMLLEQLVGVLPVYTPTNSRLPTQ